MSLGWTLFIAFLTALNIFGCLWLIWYTSRRRKDEPETTGHVWDEDIREYNKPLPRWWVNLFYLTIAFSIGYLIWYPGLGGFAGLSGWTSAAEHEAERARQEARFLERFGRYAEMPIPEIARSPEAMRFGAALFANHCAMCHGSDARGAPGFPNLRDGHWQWGGSPDAMLHTIVHGREGLMPGFAAALGSETAVSEVAVYVQSLAGMRVDPALAAAGRQRYQLICAACHGPEGRGNPLIGAPDLTAGAFTYGASFDAIRKTIAEGRHGIMPPQGPVLGELRARILAAYVWGLNQPEAGGVAAGALP